MQLVMARRVLEYEATAGSAEERAATAASRVYDKLHARMAPLVGAIGVELLFARSAKLVKGEFDWLAEVSIFEGSPKLRAYLLAQDPAVTTESAALLFGTFFALITTFIGERLTTQVLRGAWPTIEDAAEDAAPRGKDK